MKSISYVKEPSASGGLITVGITCFNEGDWLLDCWESVLVQTDDRWVSVLVMDGGASARTREIFENLNHPRLRKLAMPANVGPYPTRNKAFELTQTPYHFYLDGDDELMPNSVALALKTFEQHPGAAFVYGDCQCFGAENEIWRYPRVITEQDVVEGQPAPGPCAYKVETWRQLKGFAKELAKGNADYDFFIGTFEAHLPGYHCGQALYRYRVGHSGKVSDSYKCCYHETHEIMVHRHPSFFSDRKRRNRFLALGYRRAAIANYAAGDFTRAARLAWTACRCGMWRDRKQLVILQYWLSSRINRIFNGAYHFIRPLQGNLMKQSDRDFCAAIEASRAHTANYGTCREFRTEWLGFTDRSRDYLAQQIRSFGELVGSVTQTLSGWRVLDVGCGDGRWLRRMVDYDANPEDVVGIDVSDVRFEIGRAKNPLINLIKTDGSSIPFKDEQFNLVTQFVCFSNIPTIELRKRVANEIERVLRKGGYIFWWDLRRATAPSDPDAPIEPADYFSWSIRRLDVGPNPRPSFGLRPFRGAKFVGQLVDRFRCSDTHTAALIGPKPD
jgi:glycosyltransferase involved in cell wall biosynthesis